MRLELDTSDLKPEYQHQHVKPEEIKVDMIRPEVLKVVALVGKAHFPPFPGCWIGGGVTITRRV